jgi:hypothetical protein
VDQATALRRVNHGTAMLAEQRPTWDLHQRYLDGDHDLPFAPEGVSQEYMELRQQAPINWLPLAMGAPVQRCRIDGFRSGRGKDAQDLAEWITVWQSNRLDQRQKIVYLESMAHGRGIMSVSANPNNRDRPRVLVESSKRVWIEPDPEDPFKPLYAVKVINLEDQATSQLWLPSGVTVGASQRAYVYDDATWAKFERRGLGAQWQFVEVGTHALGDVPFVPFDVNVDAEGRPHSALAPLIPSSDAINTIRFQALLALQFSAYRQRAITGFDPVVRDENGQPVYRKNLDGSVMVDPKTGGPIPVTTTLGRVGVDRALVFPGEATKVFDLQESDMKNYVELLTEFLVQFFARAQVPPQYLLSRMANLSGDALAGAESTLSSLVSDLQAGWGESAEQVMRLSARARGNAEPDLASEVVWADAEARSFGATIDAIVKLIGTGFPKRAAFEMLPGATPQKVSRWMDLAAAEREELNREVLAEVERDLAGEGIDEEGADDGAAA